MTGIRPNFTDWRQLDALAIWQLAALMRGVDPRAWAAGDVIDRHGDALDLGEQQNQLIAGVHAGTLQPGKNEQPPLTQNTIIVTNSALEWLRSHGYAELASNLDRSLHALSPENLIKKENLIARHQRNWPTIEKDLKRANKGLDVARTDLHGIWNEALALDWARRNGKLVEGNTTLSRQASVFPE